MGIKRTPADEHPLMNSLGCKPRTGDVVQCSFCNKDFYRRPYDAQRGKRFCSLDCSNKGKMRNTEKSCLVCGEKFYRSVSQERFRGNGRFCSKKCKGEWMSENQKGENNPCWEGGKSSELRRLRSGKRFKTWREAVFQRDNYTCQMCGVRGGYLEPDHIKPFAYHPESRFDVDNGRTLCRECHKSTDTWGYKARLAYGGYQKKSG